jgi:mRNA interferase RelE/StbE
MNPYRVLISAEAQSDMLRLGHATQARILNRLRWIGDNVEHLPHATMQGEEWRGCFRYRVGDYRIIYLLDRSARELTVLRVGHRRDVYR